MIRVKLDIQIKKNNRVEKYKYVSKELEHNRKNVYSDEHIHFLSGIVMNITSSVMRK